MEIRNICCSTSSVEVIQLGRPTNLDRPLKLTTRTNNRSTSWRSLWKKLMREKRKMAKFDCSKIHSSEVHLPGYDADTYAQNFDQGLRWDEEEPDNMSRTFSMRFAAPTRFIARTSNNINSSSGNSNANSVIVKRGVTRVGHNHRDVVICVF